MEIEFLSCPTCREITLVEVPPCPDSHGEACPDRACTVCGTALAVDAALVNRPGSPTHAARLTRSVA